MVKAFFWLNTGHEGDFYDQWNWIFFIFFIFTWLCVAFAKRKSLWKLGDFVESFEKSPFDKMY
jgi:hypothetical protein